MRIKIAPSILASDFAHLADEIARIESAADLLHIDIMDGNFVPNITIGPPVVESLKGRTSLSFDVHLMISRPDEFIEAFAESGASIICVHAEACPHLHRTVESIRQRGVSPAVALNPSTPLSCIEYVLEELDMVLLMTVNPGFGGQKFISAVLRKIEKLRNMAGERNPELDIEVDGGINAETAALVAKAGANVLVAGTSVFGAPDPASAIFELRRAAEAALG